jgi:hypothetical protein
MNIWAVCCYFNLNNSESRIENFRIFRKNLKNHNIKLLCVEFNPDSNFELNNDDADIMVRFSDGDAMWQKERLLNIGIDNLPNNTDIVVILDADVVFSSRYTAQALKYELERNMVVQCFSIIGHISPYVVDCDTQDFFDLDWTNDELFLEKPVPGCIYGYQIAGNLHGGCSGYAWAFKYETIKNIKLYESNIIGGGDRIMACAFIGLPVVPPTAAGVNPHKYYEYLDKVRDYGINRDNVGYMNFPMYDLFHGIHTDRSYDKRHSILKDAAFDVTTDLIDRNGLPFKFAEHVPESLRYKIIDYFYSRNEI